MNSVLIKRFDEIKAANPHLSDFSCFCNTVTGKGFSREVIEKYFDHLVATNEYRQQDRETILEYLTTL